MNRLQLLTLCLALLLSPLATLARGEEISRYINVTGTAEAKVTPDEAVITLVIETTNKNVREALKENDQRLKKLTALLEKQGIEAKQIQTGLIQVTPVCEQTSYGKGNYSILVPQGLPQAVPVPMPVQPREAEADHSKDFKAAKTVVLRSKELAKLEEVLIGVYESSLATVQNVGYQNIAQRNIQETLRLKAIQAAREKADKLTAALGQKAGKAIRIEETGSGYGATTPAYGAYPTCSTPAVYTVGGLGQAPEQITVSASVTVWFELP